MSVVPLADVKAHLQISTTTHDDELSFFIEAAESAVAQHVGPLEPTTITRRLARSGPATLLPDRRVLSVTSVAYTDGTAISTDDVYLDTEAGLLSWSYGGAGYVTVTYEAGFDPVPADIKLAVLEFIRHLWASQRGNAMSGGARADLLGVGGEPTTAAGMAAYSLPNRVKELLAPYMSQSSIA